jgi:hypothetical protein
VLLEELPVLLGAWQRQQVQLVRWHLVAYPPKGGILNTHYVAGFY